MPKGRPVVLVDKVTGKAVRSYPSSAAAAHAEGYEPPTVTTAARLRIVPRGRFAWRYADEHDPRERFEGKCARPVAVYEGGELLFVADSVCDAARRLGASREGADAAIRRGKPLLFGRYSLRLLERMGELEGEAE